MGEGVSRTTKEQRGLENSKAVLKFGEHRRGKGPKITKAPMSIEARRKTTLTSRDFTNVRKFGGFTENSEAS